MAPVGKAFAALLATHAPRLPSPLRRLLPHGVAMALQRLDKRIHSAAADELHTLPSHILPTSHNPVQLDPQQGEMGGLPPHTQGPGTGQQAVYMTPLPVHPTAGYERQWQGQQPYSAQQQGTESEHLM